MSSLDEKKENTEIKDAKKTKKNAGMKKLLPDTARALQALNDRANKKNYGRKVKDTDIIALALSLVEPQHILQLQEATLSEEDRLNMAHENYQKNNGKITRDQFIGKLMRGEINLTQPSKA